MIGIKEQDMAIIELLLSAKYASIVELNLQDTVSEIIANR